ncbi:hypothetical protein ALT721_980029 [Alteromonas alvinellae]
MHLIKVVLSDTEKHFYWGITF